MISFSQFLSEGRDAPLYHGTDFENLIPIIKSNELFSKYSYERVNGKDGTQGVSLSRSWKFSKLFAMKRIYPETALYAIFELDQRKLAQKYRITPHNYWHTTGGRTHYGTREGQGFYNQQEEFVITDTGIKPLKQYLTRIMISDFKQLLTEKGIIDASVILDWGVPVYDMATKKLVEAPTGTARYKFLNDIKVSA